MKTKIIQNIKAVILGLIVTLGVGYAFADTFISPAGPPPGNNVPAPINVGGGDFGNIYSQTKTGVLTLFHLFTPDLTVTNPGGSITAGQVLMAKDSTGKVMWGNIPTGPGNNTTNNPPPASYEAGLYTFKSSYYLLMQDSGFRSWFTSFPGGNNALKPLTGVGSGNYKNEGWAEKDSTSSETADKLCNFFTNGPSIAFNVNSSNKPNGGSDENNWFIRWDRRAAAWKITQSDNAIAAHDISTVQCLAYNGVVRGNNFLVPSPAPTGTQCTIQAINYPPLDNKGQAEEGVGNCK